MLIYLKPWQLDVQPARRAISADHNRARSGTGSSALIREVCLKGCPKRAHERADVACRGTACVTIDVDKHAEARRRRNLAHEARRRVSRANGEKLSLERGRHVPADHKWGG